MRKIFFVFIMLITTWSSFAQWNTSGINTLHENAGNVGIGTTTPDSKLTINNTSGTGLHIGNSANWQGADILLTRNATGPIVGYSPSIQFGQDNTPYGALLQSYQGQFQFFTATNAGGWLEAMKITANGNIGLGITDPQGKMHLNAPLDGTSSIRLGSAASGNINVPLGASPGSYSIDFHTWRDVVPEQIGASIKALRINNYQPNNALVQSMDLSFLTSDGHEQSHLTEKMRIRADGNVGIGTSDPQAKLGVNGMIRATAIKVETVNWPDDVFKPSYRLPSLSTVKAYISKNRHLPEMPSEAEVAKNGVDLGEVVKLQTKKIEELTLYLIELNSHLIKQEKKIRHLLHLKDRQCSK